MAAFQIGDPVPLFILMEADDRSLGRDQASCYILPNFRLLTYVLPAYFKLLTSDFSLLACPPLLPGASHVNSKTCDTITIGTTNVGSSASGR